MDVFFLLLHNIIYDDFVLGNPYWANAREKSSAAMKREETAVSKFDYLRAQMNMAVKENTRVMIGLGCHAKSHSSPLKMLPSDILIHILGYVGIEKPHDNVVAQRRSSLAILPFEGWRQREKPGDGGIDMDLTDTSLYRPGEKITIPFSKPDFHLTGPCYRDFRKHIKEFPCWDAKRVAATAKEKKELKVYRKGTVYFVNIIYTVPGRKITKRKRATKPDPVPEPLLPKDQKKATRALENAVESAGVNRGHIDPVLLQLAVDAGYSKRFVLEKATEHWNAVKDTKPPAKRARAKRK